MYSYVTKNSEHLCKRKANVSSYIRVSNDVEILSVGQFSISEAHCAVITTTTKKMFSALTKVSVSTVYIKLDGNYTFRELLI